MLEEPFGFGQHLRRSSDDDGVGPGIVLRRPGIGTTHVQYVHELDQRPRHGVLQLEDAEESSLPETASEYAYEQEGEQIAPTCPQCGASLDGGHKLGDNLMRCPNPDCARLVFLEEPDAVTS